MGIRKVLIANRGEVAVRIIDTARKLGIDTVAVFSEVDADSPHVSLADESVPLGAPAPYESYLSIPKILSAARETGADAVHPGYGFLAENAELALACGRAGLTFVGPEPDAISLMGNKRAAKQRMSQAGLPIVPGYCGEDQTDARLLREAGRIGSPVMVKAAAGGGGRGIRLVTDLDDLPDALQAARAEAVSAFDDAELILERALARVRHIEIQVFADNHGNVIHLGERDCSIQRRHQKVIEEAPSPAVSPALREKMGEAACLAARSINYCGAGTVEFLVDENSEFYFLEMNTRLQVEHPVTEMITGLDLVAWQFAVAEGKPLPLSQQEIEFSGHAIEARLYAEDADQGFQPQSGDVARWVPAQGAHIRVDHALVEGQTITPDYDAMVAKIIAYGKDRGEAIHRLRRAVRESVLLGVTSNKSFLTSVLDHEAFGSGKLDTGFLAKHFSESNPNQPQTDSTTVAIAALALFLQVQREADPITIAHGPIAWPVDVYAGGRMMRCAVTVCEGHYAIRVEGGKPHAITDIESSNGKIVCTFDGVRRKLHIAATDHHTHIDMGDRVIAVSRSGTGRARHEAGAREGEIRASMNGRIVEILIEPGQVVQKGQAVVVLEAMKMHHHLKAPTDGVAGTIRVAAGQQVDRDAVLISLTTREPAGEPDPSPDGRG